MRAAAPSVVALAAAMVACSPQVSPPDASTHIDAAAPPDLAILDMAGPRRLSWTGLYADIGEKRLAPDVLEFTPTHALWSDGADKTRWVRLPPGARIDTSDMDRWRFPVGTLLFKEFSRGGRRLETRLVEKIADTGDDETDYWVGAFLWLDDESDAVFVEQGAGNVRGTDHDVPSALQCWRCHVGEPGRVLGFSALQLAGDGAGLRLDDLVHDGRLTSPPPAGARYGAPGTPVERAALGYLHANCGHCHNPRGNGWQDSDLDLRLSVADATPAATAVVRSAVGVPLMHWKPAPYTMRVVAGRPSESGLHHRMTVRGSEDQMPSLASEHVDPAGVGAVRAWIESLAP